MNLILSFVESIEKNLNAWEPEQVKLALDFAKKTQKNFQTVFSATEHILTK